MKCTLGLMLALMVSACAVVSDGGNGNSGSGKAGGDTVTVCHKGKKTLELPRSAAQAHLNHGDRTGPC